MAEKESIFNTIPDLGYTEEAPLCDTNAFAKVVESRRSIRVYTSEKIPDDIVMQCLRMGLLAPNSSNLQPWQFYWVTNETQKKDLASYCLGQPSATTAATLIVAVARPDFWKVNQQQMLAMFDETNKEKLKNGFKYYHEIVPMAYNQGPLGIMGLIKRCIFWYKGLKVPFVRSPKSYSDMRVWAHKSTALACENIMLAFRAYNYDSCPMEGMDEKRIMNMLGLKSPAEICMVISAGKRNAAKGVYGKQIRFPEEQFIKKI
jgi:nitroreductase